MFLSLLHVFTVDPTSNVVLFYLLEIQFPSQAVVLVEIKSTK